MSTVVSEVKAREEALERLEAPFGAVDTMEEGLLKVELLRMRDEVPRRVQLNGCAIGDGGARLVAEALRVGSSVRELYIMRCAIGTVGALHLAEMLRVDRSVEELYLTGNSSGAPEKKRLFVGVARAATCTWEQFLR